MKTQKRYSIKELSALTDLPARTIRYYIQEGIVDKPEGQFRGAYYTDRHLRQLATVKKYRDAGVSLERIAQILHEERSGEPFGCRVRPGTVEVVSRIHLAEGVELQVNPETSGLSQAQIRRLSKELLALMDAIRKDEK
jgi:DNA-binding transcriptional MerR regulator